MNTTLAVRWTRPVGALMRYETLRDRKTGELLDARCAADMAAQEVLSEPEPQQPPPVDVAAWRTSVRNRVLAGSGVKAQWFGTLSAPPVYGAADLQPMGLTAAAATLLAGCRDELRAAALALEIPVAALAVKG